MKKKETIKLIAYIVMLLIIIAMNVIIMVNAKKIYYSENIPFFVKWMLLR